MPMMDLTLEEGALSKEAKARLVDDLTAVLLEFEEPEHHPSVRPVTWCFVDELPARSTSGDRPPSGRPVYQVLLTVPECGSGHGGPARAFRRDRLVQRVTELVLGAEGTPVTPSDRLRVRVQLREVREGFVDACGEILRIDDCAEELPSCVQLDSALGPASPRDSTRP